MADTTITGLTRQTTTTTSFIVPISNGLSTVGIPISGLVTASGSMGTGFIQLPAGTTAQRVGIPSVGAVRFNTSINNIEYYDGTNWSGDKVIADVLIVGGGGGGNSSYIGNGGGGGGGVLTLNNYTLVTNTNYTVTIGQGGNGLANSVSVPNTQIPNYQVATNGGDSYFGNARAFGGGIGGGDTSFGTVNGGSGGGGGGISTQTSNNGGVGYGNSGFSNYRGGGGGAGSASTGVNGGAGFQWIDGNYYGGGGAGWLNGSGTGGIGGGGNSGISGTPNTGGGGGGNNGVGGDSVTTLYATGFGGSGVVKVRYPTASNIVIGAGLTYTTIVAGIIKTTTFTQGTGTIYFT